MKLILLMHRTHRTIGHALSHKPKPNPRKKFTEAEERQVVRFTKSLTKRPRVARTIVEKEIRNKVIDKFDRDVCRSTLLRVFRRQKVYFGSPPKCNIPDDVVRDKRMQFAAKYKNKTTGFWSNVDAFLDNKKFRVYNTPQSKVFCCRKSLKGVYRQKGDKWTYKQSKPNPKLKLSGGAKAIEMSLAVNTEGVVMSRLFDKNWNGHQACLVYKNLAKSIWDSGRKRVGEEIVILEDGDPAGYESKKAKKMKEELNIKVIKLPPYSPCLNPLDYSVFAEIESLMTDSNRELLERGVGNESRQSYVNRLRRKTKSLKSEYLKKTIHSLPARLKRLHSLNGDIWKD